MILLGVCMQQVADYVRDDIFPLVNRDTGFMLILIVCNNTIGYPGGPERGFWLRTPEFSVTRYLLPLFTWHRAHTVAPSRATSPHVSRPPLLTKRGRPPSRSCIAVDQVIEE